MPSQNKHTAPTDSSSPPSPSASSIDQSVINEDVHQAKRLKSYHERYDTQNKTNEEVLSMYIDHFDCFSFLLISSLTEEQSSRWKSDVYQHFLPAEIIIGKGGAVYYKFVCKK